MAFATAGRSDSRRRRMLMQSNSESPSSDRDSQSDHAIDSTGRRCYHPAAARDSQPAITRLIPHRVLTHFILASLGLGISLLLIDGWILRLEAPRSWSVPTALDAATPGSLADWAIGLACLGAAAAMLLVYSVRRHRVDDYRGRYRLWLWAAAGCVVASADATTRLSEQLAQLAASATAITAPFAAVVSQTWPLVLAAVLGLFLVWELLESRVATIGLGLAATTTVAGALLTTHAVVLSDPVLHQLAELSLRLASVWCLLGGICWYARHVDRIANGLVPRRASAETETGVTSRSKSPSRRRKRKSENDAAGRREEGHHDESARPRSAQRRRAKKPADPAETATTADAQPPAKGPKPGRQPTKPTSSQPAKPEAQQDDPMAGLSKAERRRLRKQKRREARRNAA